jgi:hypothetical protein
MKVRFSMFSADDKMNEGHLSAPQQWPFVRMWKCIRQTDGQRSKGGDPVPIHQKEKSQTFQAFQAFDKEVSFSCPWWRFRVAV